MYQSLLNFMQSTMKKITLKSHYSVQNYSQRPVEASPHLLPTHHMGERMGIAHPPHGTKKDNQKGDI